MTRGNGHTLYIPYEIVRLGVLGRVLCNRTTVRAPTLNRSASAG